MSKIFQKCNKKIAGISTQKSKKCSNETNKDILLCQIAPKLVLISIFYVSLFLWFSHFLHIWPDILTIFSLQFWKILDIKILFWNKLTCTKTNRCTKNISNFPNHRTVGDILSLLRYPHFLAIIWNSSQHECDFFFIQKNLCWCSAFCIQRVVHKWQTNKYLRFLLIFGLHC